MFYVYGVIGKTSYISLYVKREEILYSPHKLLKVFETRDQADRYIDSLLDE